MAHRQNMYRVRSDELCLRMEVLGISGRKLAELAGCSRHTTCGLWSGRIKYVSESIARSIAEALSCKLEALFTPANRTAWERTCK